MNFVKVHVYMRSVTLFCILYIRGIYVTYSYTFEIVGNYYIYLNTSFLPVCKFHIQTDKKAVISTYCGNACL